MFKHILIPVDMDATELTNQALTVAEELSAHDGAKVTALTVIPDFNSSLVASYFPENTIEKAHDQVCRDLKKFIDTHAKDPSKISCAVNEGSTRKRIVNYIEEHDVDLVVIPARKSNISKLLLGSNSSYVVDHARCSVLVVRPS
jgi:nucleotide-binding universal stress UspA family protein